MSPLSFGPLRAFLTNLCLLVALTLFMAQRANAQQSGQTPEDIVKRVQALPANERIAIDGRLTEEAWSQAAWVSDFVQLEPVEGAAPSGRTEVAFRFTDDALYVAARMTSADPSTINSLVARRDVESNAEQFVVSLDTYRNRRTTYAFAVTAGGTRIDYFTDSDSRRSRDYSFDPVWSAAARITADGWVAEMRIPFSQLRFNDAETQIWGLNLNRSIPSENEDVYWVLIPRDGSGWASRFGSLEGIRDIRPSRRLEVMPYVAAGGTAAGDVNPDNPFTSSFDTSSRVGLDAKVGLGSSLTLDVTVNPDFGQVEADPAEVNLTAFETFFDERRPFFAEGGDLLRSGLFYSRRIGASPRGRASGDFVDAPDATTILGASKLSGRLSNGLSVAALVAATQSEYARTFDLDTQTRDRVRVEPLASYAAFAAQQEIGGQGSIVGVRATAVNRDLDDADPLASRLNQSAYAAELNWNIRFDGGAYVIDGGAGFTHVNGSAARISSLQRSPVHYFQRPDADHVELDPLATSLTGYKADIYLGKHSGRFTAESYLGYESPGLNSNDLGRLGRADEIAWFAQVGYRELEPGDLFHRYSVSVNSFNGWNAGGTKTSTGVDGSFNVTWKNFWRTNLFAGYNPTEGSDTATRGGPRMAIAGERNIAIEVASNQSRKFSAAVYAYREVDELERLDKRFRLGLNWQPSERLDLSLSPGYAKLLANRQYVRTLPGGPQATFGSRYIFALIDRSQLSASLRLNYTFRPDFTIELYAEPFAASGRYYRHGELEEAGGLALREYGSAPGTSIVQTEDGYTVDDQGETFSLPNSDFRFVSFRSNAVLRWEWRPGSTLFVVWQQDRSGFDRSGRFVGPGALTDALSATGDNFFGLKLSYWLPVD